MSNVASGVLGGVVVAGAAVGVGYALWYLWQHGAAGTGFGFGKGGDSIFKTGGTASPEDADSGPGGASAKPGGTGDTDQGSGTDSKNGGDSSGGKKPNDGKGGTGQTSGSGTGSSKTDDDGKGSGGSGGGIGGGSGGGVGEGEGSGTSGGEGDGGSAGDDDGGGEPEHGGGYDPWGGQVIQQDLEPPDLSGEKLDEVTNVILELVGGSILDPGLIDPDLPGPLKVFDPMLGGLLLFWADVALHKVWELPPGRLDPDNETHIPWINLWLDILSEVSTADRNFNPPEEDLEYDDTEFTVWEGLGARSTGYRSLDYGRIERRGSRLRRNPLYVAMFPRLATKKACCAGCELGLGCVAA